MNIQFAHEDKEIEAELELHFTRGGEVSHYDIDYITVVHEDGTEEDGTKTHHYIVAVEEWVRSHQTEFLNDAEEIYQDLKMQAEVDAAEARADAKRDEELEREDGNLRRFFDSVERDGRDIFG